MFLYMKAFIISKETYHLLPIHSNFLVIYALECNLQPSQQTMRLQSPVGCLVQVVFVFGSICIAVHANPSLVAYIMLVQLTWENVPVCPLAKVEKKQEDVHWSCSHKRVKSFCC
jgi:molybdenum cofactor biosynthesis enzyme